MMHTRTSSLRNTVRVLYPRRGIAATVVPSSASSLQQERRDVAATAVWRQRRHHGGTETKSLSFPAVSSRSFLSIHVPSCRTASSWASSCPTSLRGRRYSTTPRTMANNDNDDDAGAVVYESPFGNLVSRLRYVSLMTALAGSLGLPVVVALKGTTPTGGFVALCLSFGTGSLASTAAIHYVFKPYVFYIERIPVRKCHIPKETTTETTTAINNTPASQSYLYKAVTKSLFLRPIETVFDPTMDGEVTKYKGFALPLCNLVVRDSTHLFVHAESIYDNTLQATLPLGPDGETGASGRTTATGKPARQTAADEDEAYHGY